ncbi:solute carrier family 23 member 1-like isoform X3 [Lineus longissimus]|uniref:solute carrier family 23 member 1-like isoform X3 n=1 Tax=Lineus longissimus TaxID=88925 RepID=UPI002B4DDC48
MKDDMPDDRDSAQYSIEDGISSDVSPTGENDVNIQCSSDANLTKATSNTLQYTIEEIPPWYLCILLGFQHYLTMFGATVAIPLILANWLCMGDDNLARSELISTIFFVSGIATLLQSTFGSRLPIVQGGTFSFLAPTYAILSLPKWACPTADTSALQVAMNMTTTMATSTVNMTLNSGPDREVWQVRMREIQGAIMVASIFQIVIGFSGIIGLLLQFIGPLAITPTIALVGLSLFEAAYGFASSHWWISMLTIAFIIVFSQYLKNVHIPCASYSKGKGCAKKATYPLFNMFPVILSIALSWVVCYIFTVTNVFPNDPKAHGYKARTDIRTSVLQEAAWFRFPYPGQWGVPTVSASAVFGMLAGVLASMIESVGDYYACARLSGAPPPPVHAVNRGIGMEGIGCVLAGAWGTGNGTTSYSENIGAIGITKVGSRIVIQVGGFMMLLFGMFGKFGALFVTIPEPVTGGMFIIMFGMITAVGISNLQFVDMNSSRNLFILGFSFFFGLTLPQWMNKNPAAIQTGVEALDQIFTVLLSTSMFVGGFCGFVLDNTVPGTREERGLIGWEEILKDSDGKAMNTASIECYDLPWCMKHLSKVKCFKYIPFCPSFDFDCRGACCRKRRGDSNEDTMKTVHENLSFKSQETAL